MIQAHDIYYELYFYYYYISLTSDHQTLDPWGWGALTYFKHSELPFSPLQKRR